MVAALEVAVGDDWMDSGAHPQRNSMQERIRKLFRDILRQSPLTGGKPLISG